MSDTMTDSELESAEALREARWNSACRVERRRSLLVLALLFGAVGPGLCFWFYWGLGGVGLFGPMETAFAAAAALGLSTLAVQLLRRSWAPKPAAILAGMLLSSALQALLVGLVLLPFSLPLLVFGIGLLGLIPLGTAWTLQRAWREAREFSAPLEPLSRYRFTALGFVCSSLFPLIHPTAQLIAYDVAFARLDEGTPESLERSSEVLAWVPWLSADPLVEAARWEEDETRCDRLCRLYELRFGEVLDIDYLRD